MSGPARAGALIYAKHLHALSAFYQSLLSMTVQREDAEHQVLSNGDLQLILHAMPAAVAAAVEVTVPPQLRESQALKLFFTVPSLAQAEAVAADHGGGVFGPVYDGPGFRVRNAFDPEGNIFHLRATGP